MAGIKGKSGRKKGTGGRKPGAKNKVPYDVKKKMAECLDETFMQKIFTEIEDIDVISKRVELRLKIVDYFVPKPRHPEDIEQENEFKKEFLERIFPKI